MQNSNTGKTFRMSFGRQFRHHRLKLTKKAPFRSYFFSAIITCKSGGQANTSCHFMHVWFYVFLFRFTLHECTVCGLRFSLHNPYKQVYFKSFNCKQTVNHCDAQQTCVAHALLVSLEYSESFTCVEKRHSAVFRKCGTKCTCERAQCMETHSNV